MINIVSIFLWSEGCHKTVKVVEKNTDIFTISSQESSKKPKKVNEGDKHID